MPRYTEGQKIVVLDRPNIQRHFVGRVGVIKYVVPLNVERSGEVQNYTVDLYSRREDGINPKFPLLGIYFHEDEIDPFHGENPQEEPHLSNTIELLKDIDKEIKEVQDSAHLLQKWGFVDQGSQASYAAGTFSRLRDRLVQALKKDGVDTGQ